jgi:hypothetical protein
MEESNPAQGLQVIVPLEEFAEDLDLRLGRANGNIFHRREGVEGVNDGQVMVRLKKKRFIIIDYSIVPTTEDIQAAEANPHISVPNGAGRQKCASPECSKVGIPVLLYDSEPNEPSSLYMRSGLCFSCQRNLNEKRRTQRKRTSEGGTNSVLYAVGPGQKKFKLNGNTMELNSDAIILNGPPEEGAKSVKDGFSFDEIGPDLGAAVQEASSDTLRLIHAITSNTTTTPSDLGAVSVEEAANAAVEASTSMLNGGTPTHPPASSEDINGLYDKAFGSLSKSVYLLTQWKQSWDSAIAAAVAHETVGDPSLAEAVASAAVIAAAASDGPDSNSNNMASLLLAADQKGSSKADVESFEV